MDVLGVKQMKGRRQSKRSKKDIKVVYISSPMKINTCASKFRALVQELTGKDSDVALQFMDTDYGAQNSLRVPDHNRGVRTYMPAVEFNNESPICSDSAFEPFDDVLVPQMEGGFMEMLTSNIFHESSIPS
ncbi:VQ domain-containing protein [Cephalotus follicularis]|uniref:VQ domain-containing protein n=1 Tax=Cephalotus follicularis TaxID=3775 RepID=A0A1Q3BN64_CEPFO|nr:VQ domain-containing protein [Cephalotus follicularis]